MSFYRQKWFLAGLYQYSRPATKILPFVRKQADCDPNALRTLGTTLPAPLGSPILPETRGHNKGPVRLSTSPEITSFLIVWHPFLLNILYIIPVLGIPWQSHLVFYVELAGIDPPTHQKKKKKRKEITGQLVLPLPFFLLPSKQEALSRVNTGPGTSPGTNRSPFPNFIPVDWHGGRSQWGDLPKTGVVACKKCLLFCKKQEVS